MSFDWIRNIFDIEINLINMNQSKSNPIIDQINKEILIEQVTFLT